MAFMAVGSEHFILYLNPVIRFEKNKILETIWTVQFYDPSSWRIPNFTRIKIANN